MRACILTLRFSPTLGGFDDSALQQLVREHDLFDLREHIVMVDGQPCIVCVALWQDRVVQPTARCTTEPATDHAAPAQRNGPATPVPDILQGMDEAQRALFARIRSWRSRTAHSEGVPPYVLLTNRQLVEIVRHRPDSRAGLGRIDGLGDKKLDRYGEALLTMLRPAVPAEAPATAEAGT